MMAEQRTFDDPTDVLDFVLRKYIGDVRVSMPARVVSYDATRQAVTVEPLIMEVVEDEGGDETSQALPLINDVPVAFPGAGAYSITWPLNKGDTVLLVFSDRSLDRWLQRGGKIDPLLTKDPGAARSHHLSDAIAIPGLRDFAHPVENVPKDATVITVPDDTELRLGGVDATGDARRVITKQDLLDFLEIAGTVADTAGAIAALKTALEGADWPTGATKARAE